MRYRKQLTSKKIAKPGMLSSVGVFQEHTCICWSTKHLWIEIVEQQIRGGNPFSTMTKKSFQDSMDWDDIMFDKQPSATGVASEWNDFSLPNFTSDATKSEAITPMATKESTSTKVSNQKESQKGSKKPTTNRSTDLRPDSPNEDDNKSRTVRKQSSTTQSVSSSKNRSPRREGRRQQIVKHHDDNDVDSDSGNGDDDNHQTPSNSRRTSQANNKESSIRRSPSVSRRKERQSVSLDKYDEKKQELATKLKRDKLHTCDNESKRETKKSSDESSVRRRDKSPTSKGERSHISKDDDTVNDKNERKSKPKKEKSRKYDAHDDDTTHRGEVTTRKNRSINTDDKLDDQSQTTRDSSHVRRSRNGQLSAEQLSQSRQRAVQRMEARNNWRESQRKSITTPTTTASTPSEDDRIDSRRTSLLDQSRRGPIRSFKCNYDDDDDDDFSVLSGMTSSSFTVDDTLDAPFVVKNIKNSVSAVSHPSGSGSRGGGYLPNSLNTNTNDNGAFQKKERRPSAFGTGYERAMALNMLKNEIDNDSDEEGSSYALPTGLSRAAGTQFEIDRSGRGSASTRRPSLSTTLTVPCINGIDDSDNDDDLYSKSTDRRGSLSSKEFDLSSKVERRGSLSQRNADDDIDGNNKKTGVNYDSTVEDMLKSRRLRGARGDAAKKKEETKSVKKTRGLSISMLTNLVQSAATKATPETPLTGSTPHRRASTAM